MTVSRREFLRTGALATLGVACTRRVAVETGARPSRVAPGTVLFQGDSITDVFRNRATTGPNSPQGLGSGYPMLIATARLHDAPNEPWRFLNRGISGNRVPDLDARWADDTIALTPGLLSILIGVNDYWHVRLGRSNGTRADFDTGLGALLDRTRAALPSVRLVLLEPFVLPIGAVDTTWLPEMVERRAIVRRHAERMRAVFVPLQDAFTEAAARSTPDRWLYDGVHPAPAGHALIAERWRAAVGI